MKDGASPHYANLGRDLMDNTFPGRWKGRRGPLDWLAGSPYLSPCNFLLWGWAKDQVYQREPQTIDQLEEVIHNVISNIEFLGKTVVEEVPRRLQKLTENGGCYLEI